jgi:tRNA(His) 5'-end guanylyltransferase
MMGSSQQEPTMSRDADDFGDRMKGYEAADTGRASDPALPLLARLDGHSFSELTRPLAKPFDERFSALMRETMLALVRRFHATFGYVQSDEITLCWLPPRDGEPATVPFAGRFQKLDSLMAGYASVYFSHDAHVSIPELRGNRATFDCRAWNVPSETEAYNAVLWRQLDAEKNAISMAAQRHFRPQALHEKNGAEKIRMLAEAGVDFHAYPAWFRRGTFALRSTEARPLSPEQLARIPPQFRAQAPAEVVRSFVDLRDVKLLAQAEPLRVLRGEVPPVVST